MNKFALLAALILSAPATAQEPSTGSAPKLALELNALQSAEAGCRVTFLATNDLGNQLDQASIEMALFDKQGAIERIVTLDFKGLAPGKTKVLQFQLGGLECDKLGRVLVNDITACTGADLAADACLTGLVTTVRPDIAFGV